MARCTVVPSVSHAQRRYYTLCMLCSKHWHSATLGLAVRVLELYGSASGHYNVHSRYVSGTEQRTAWVDQHKGAHQFLQCYIVHTATLQQLPAQSQ
eukprot:6628-Heterococcus_DN1.PRE.2